MGFLGFIHGAVTVDMAARKAELVVQLSGRVRHVKEKRATGSSADVTLLDPKSLEPLLQAGLGECHLSKLCFARASVGLGTIELDNVTSRDIAGASILGNSLLPVKRPLDAT